MKSREIKFRAWDGEAMFVPLYLDRNGYVVRKMYGPSERDGIVLMQFTGLHDKNGVEIYEGDILQPHRHTKSRLMRCEVYYNISAFRLRGPQHTGRPLSVCMADAAKAANEYVVIGNIYENPDLLSK